MVPATSGVNLVQKARQAFRSISAEMLDNLRCGESELIRDCVKGRGNYQQLNHEPITLCFLAIAHYRRSHKLRDIL